MNTVFAPGCALFINDSQLAEKVAGYLRNRHGITEIHDTCCHHKPDFKEETKIVCLCSGCIRRYDSLYDYVSALSLWELIDTDDSFPFPDYSGYKMSVLDTCPTRKYENLHKSVRSLLNKMNIEVAEPERTGTNGKCCGDSFYGNIPKKDVLEKMKERADEMPANDVAVYCVSCVKSVSNGGKTPQYLPALLFSTQTVTGKCDPDAWHAQVDAFIGTH